LKENCNKCFVSVMLLIYLFVSINQGSTVDGG